MSRTNYNNDNDVRFVQDHHAQLDFYSANSLKQRSSDRHVTSFRQIILIPIQPFVLFLLFESYMLSGEIAIANFLVFGLTRPGLKPIIYHTQGEHDDITSLMDFSAYVKKTSIKILFQS